MPLMDRKTYGERQCGEKGRQRRELGGPPFPRRPWAYLAQGTGSNDIVHKLHSEPAAQMNGLHVALASPWEGGEEKAHGEGIVQVP